MTTTETLRLLESWSGSVVLCSEASCTLGLKRPPNCTASSTKQQRWVGLGTTQRRQLCTMQSTLLWKSPHCYSSVKKTEFVCLEKIPNQMEEGNGKRPWTWPLLGNWVLVRVQRPTFRTLTELLCWRPFLMRATAAKLQPQGDMQPLYYLTSLPKPTKNGFQAYLTL